MTATHNPLSKVANSTAIQLAEGQYRLARYFTPFNFDPERIDYDRVAVFLDDVYKAFPNPSPNMAQRLADLQSQIASHREALDALKQADANPTLDEDQLYTTARANVINPAGAGAAQ